MKSIFTKIGLVFIIIICLSLVVYSVANTGTITRKIKGIFSVKNGVLVEEMSEKEKDKISKSFDKNTKQRENDFDSQGYIIESEELKPLAKNKKEIKFIDDWGKEKVLKFEYVSNTDKKILLPVNTEEYYKTYNIPNKDSYILQNNYSLYYLDIEKQTINSILKDTEKYKKDIFEKLDSEDFTAIWADNPCINLTGDKLTYFSNRKYIVDKNCNGEIWFLNMTTGEEYSLGEIGYNCLGWDSEDNVYYIDYNNNVVKVNVADKTKEIVYQDAPIETKLVFPSLIMPEYNKLTIFSLNDYSTETYNNKEIGVVFNIVPNQGNSKIIFGNQKDSSKPDTNLLLFDLKLKELKAYEIINKATIDRYSWISDSEILLSVREFDSIDQNTYILDIDKFYIIK